MVKGFSMHIGAGILDDSYQASNLGDMPSATQDAKDMKKLLSNNFTDKILLIEKDASTTKVKETINNFTKGTDKLNSGDILVVTYAGHGGQILNDHLTEPDCRDETWCLYDSQLLDDELSALWSEFEEDVRIFVISDSCHSGSILDFFKIRITEEERILLLNKGFNFNVFEKFVLRAKGFDFINLTDSDKSIWKNNRRILSSIEDLNGRIHFDNLSSFEAQTSKIRTLPAEILKYEYQTNISKYIDRKNAAKEVLRNKYIKNYISGYKGYIKASVTMLSACLDYEKAYVDRDEVNGLFTKSLLTVWNSGNFKGNYLRFHHAIWKQTKSVQNPNYYRIGIPNPAFELQTPFTI